VFRNRLKFNEYVRALETILPRQRHRRAFTGSSLITLILLPFAASGFPKGGIGIGRQSAKMARNCSHIDGAIWLIHRERNEVKTPTLGRFGS
jgi:hypothetical protein